MGAPEDEEKLLRSAAMQNANSILLARRRAEEALANSLAMVRATLESTTDGILVTDATGEITDYNEKFLQMWPAPRELVSSGHARLQEFTRRQLKDPEAFLARTKDIYASWPPETFDLLEFADGRVFERYSKIQQVGERKVGRVWSFRDITERKKSEEQLHQQREWLRVTLSSIGDAVITTDTQSRVTFLNPVAELMTGWKSTEAAGQPLEKVFNIINEETRQPAFNPVSKVLREGVTVGLANHTALISRDGTETAIEDSAAPIKDAAGNISGVVMVFHDVTERRKVELSLQLSHAQFSAIINQSPVGICLVDDQLRLRHVNPKARPAFDDVPDLIGSDWGEIIHRHWPKPLADEIESRFRHTLKTGESYLAQGFTGERADRKVREYYDWEIHRIGLPEGRHGVVVYFTDISGHVLAQEALRESEERFRTTFNQAAVGMATASLEGRFEQVNTRMAEILGYPLAELYERTFLSITHPEDVSRTQQEVRRLLAGEISDYVMEKRYLRKDGGMVWSLTTVTLLKDAAGRPQHFIGVIEDITARKQAEATVREATERLQLARAAAEQANQAKDHFLAALSHELRTPLTPVLALLSSLCEDPALPPAIIHDLETMRRNVELEARLIDDLLDLTRVSRGKLELQITRVRLGRVIEDAIGTCLPEIKHRQLSLVREIDEPEKMILVDGARITQILWNLLKNSIKFTPVAGTITIRTRVQPGADVERLIIEVQDTGMGMEPEQIPRVFEAFEQGNRSITRQFGGLGLGLAISRAIARSHHGTLTATSAGTDRGSVFKLTLPAQAIEVEADPPVSAREGKAFPAASAKADGVRPLKILLVEDHADTAKSLSMLLSRRGYVVSLAGDVRTALKLAAEEKFDLLLSDLGLPDATGYELMSQIRERHSIPGIALSGYGMEEDVRKCHEAGFSGHIVKPVRISQLEEALARIVPRH